MKGGTVEDFVEYLYTCQDTAFIYKGITYWYQGYMPNDHTVHMELYACNPPDDNDLWNHDGATIDEGVQDLLKAPLFDGKTILEVEQDIERIDS